MEDASVMNFVSQPVMSRVNLLSVLRSYFVFGFRILPNDTIKLTCWIKRNRYNQMILTRNESISTKRKSQSIRCYGQLALDQ